MSQSYSLNWHEIGCKVDMFRILLASLALAMITFNAFVPSLKEEKATIVSALKAGDAKELSSFLNNSLILRIGNEDKSCSKEQAIVLLRSFFAEQDVTGFTLSYSTNNTRLSGNYVGMLSTRSGNYRTTYTAKRLGSSVLINELAFEK